MDNTQINISNEELVTVREGMRRLNQFVDALESGNADKFVLMRKGQMVAVIISIDEFNKIK